MTILYLKTQVALEKSLVSEHKGNKSPLPKLSIEYLHETFKNIQNLMIFSFQNGKNWEKRNVSHWEANTLRKKELKEQEMGTSQQCPKWKGCQLDEKTAKAMYWETHGTGIERHSKPYRRGVRKEDQ